MAIETWTGRTYIPGHPLPIRSSTPEVFQSREDALMEVYKRVRDGLGTLTGTVEDNSREMITDHFEWKRNDLVWHDSETGIDGIMAHLKIEETETRPYTFFEKYVAGVNKISNELGI